MTRGDLSLPYLMSQLSRPWWEKEEGENWSSTQPRLGGVRPTRPGRHARRRYGQHTHIFDRAPPAWLQCHKCQGDGASSKGGGKPSCAQRGDEAPHGAVPAVAALQQSGRDSGVAVGRPATQRGERQQPHAATARGNQSIGQPRPGRGWPWPPASGHPCAWPGRVRAVRSKWLEGGE
jgi:hypothetical protein